MHGHEVAKSVDGRSRDVVAAALDDEAVPWRRGGQFRAKLARAVRIADEHRAVPPHQPDRHSHTLGCRLIEITQILNIDDTDDHSKKSATRSADAAGEIHTRLSG